MQIKQRSIRPQMTFFFRTIAAATALCFITGSLAGTFELSANPISSVPNETKTIDLSKPLTIPGGIGKIEEVFQATGSRLQANNDCLQPETCRVQPLVILIQDAHAVPEAQKSIQKLIEFFQKEYGVSLTALEGASTELDPQFFKSFPDKELLRETFEEYFAKGELAGSTAAAILAEGKGSFHGIENWELYEKGLSLYLEAVQKEPAILEKLQAASDRLQEAKKRLFSKQLLEIDTALKSFEENSTALLPILTKLASIQAVRGQVGISTSQPVPLSAELALLLAEAEREKEDSSSIEREVRDIAEEVRGYIENRMGLTVGAAPRGRPFVEGQATPKVSDTFSVSDTAAFNQKYQEFQTSRISPEAFALFLKACVETVGAAPRGRPLIRGQVQEIGQAQGPAPTIKISDRLNFLMKTHKHLRDIQGTDLFKDFQLYAQSVKESLFRNEKERELDKQSRELLLLEKLAKLELSREEWEEIKTRDYRPGTSDQGQTGIQDDSLWAAHFAFYKNAENRDQVFFRNLLKLMAQPKPLVFSPKSQVSSPALLVAGGFHTEGLARQFKEKGISYVVVTPTINSIPENSLYRQHMQGDVSWKDYFEVKNGRINPYEAFARGVRDQLLGMNPESWVLRKQEDQKSHSRLIPQDSRPLLKQWRDQILRDLAEKEQLTKAHEYTQFLDEVAKRGQAQNPNNVPVPFFHELRTQWVSNVDRLLEKLQHLNSRGQLNQQNVLKLLKPATIIDSTGPLVLASTQTLGIVPSYLKPHRENTIAGDGAALIPAKPRSEVRTGSENKRQDKIRWSRSIAAILGSFSLAFVIGYSSLHQSDEVEPGSASGEDRIGVEDRGRQLNQKDPENSPIIDEENINPFFTKAKDERADQKNIDPPVAMPGLLRAVRDTPVLMNLQELAKAKTVEGGYVTYEIQTPPKHGMFLDDRSGLTIILGIRKGLFMYQPHQGYTGSDSFTFTVSENIVVRDGKLALSKITSPPVKIMIEVSKTPRRLEHQYEYSEKNGKKRLNFYLNVDGTKTLIGDFNIPDYLKPVGNSIGTLDLKDTAAVSRLYFEEGDDLFPEDLRHWEYFKGRTPDRDQWRLYVDFIGLLRGEDEVDFPEYGPYEFRFTRDPHYARPIAVGSKYVIDANGTSLKSRLDGRPALGGNEKDLEFIIVKPPVDNKSVSERLETPDNVELHPDGSFIYKLGPRLDDFDFEHTRPTGFTFKLRDKRTGQESDPAKVRIDIHFTALEEPEDKELGSRKRSEMRGKDGNEDAQPEHASKSSVWGSIAAVLGSFALAFVVGYSAFRESDNIMPGSASGTDRIVEDQVSQLKQEVHEKALIPDEENINPFFTKAKDEMADQKNIEPPIAIPGLLRAVRDTPIFLELREQAKDSTDFKIKTPPKHGTLKSVFGGSDPFGWFIYEPHPGYVGYDSFIYTHDFTVIRHTPQKNDVLTTITANIWVSAGSFKHEYEYSEKEGKKRLNFYLNVDRTKTRLTAWIDVPDYLKLIDSSTGALDLRDATASKSIFSTLGWEYFKGKTADKDRWHFYQEFEGLEFTDDDEFRRRDYIPYAFRFERDPNYAKPIAIGVNYQIDSSDSPFRSRLDGRAAPGGNDKDLEFILVDHDGNEISKIKNQKLEFNPDGSFTYAPRPRNYPNDDAYHDYMHINFKVRDKRTGQYSESAVATIRIRYPAKEPSDEGTPRSELRSARLGLSTAQDVRPSASRSELRPESGDSGTPLRTGRSELRLASSKPSTARALKPTASRPEVREGRFLARSDEFFPRELNILKDFAHQAATYVFAFMQGYNSRAAIGMTKENVTSFLPNRFKSQFLENANNLSRLKRGETAQQATWISWIPTNLSGFGTFLWTLIQSWMASLIRFINSGRVLAWVWQPGKAGTEPTSIPSSSPSINTRYSNFRMGLPHNLKNITGSNQSQGRDNLSRSEVRATKSDRITRSRELVEETMQMIAWDPMDDAVRMRDYLGNFLSNFEKEIEKVDPGNQKGDAGGILKRLVGTLNAAIKVVLDAPESEDKLKRYGKVVNLLITADNLLQKPGIFPRYVIGRNYTPDQVIQAIPDLLRIKHVKEMGYAKSLREMIEQGEFRPLFTISDPSNLHGIRDLLEDEAGLFRLDIVSVLNLRGNFAGTFDYVVLLTKESSFSYPGMRGENRRSAVSRLRDIENQLRVFAEVIPAGEHDVALESAATQISIASRAVESRNFDQGVKRLRGVLPRLASSNISRMSPLVNSLNLALLDIGREIASGKTVSREANEIAELLVERYARSKEALLSRMRERAHSDTILMANYDDPIRNLIVGLIKEKGISIYDQNDYIRFLNEIVDVLSGFSLSEVRTESPQSIVRRPPVKALQPSSVADRGPKSVDSSFNRAELRHSVSKDLESWKGEVFSSGFNDEEKIVVSKAEAAMYAPKKLLLFDIAEKLGLKMILAGGTARDFAISQIAKKEVLPKAADYDLGFLFPREMDENDKIKAAFNTSAYQKFEAQIEEIIGKDTEVDRQLGEYVGNGYAFEHRLRGKAGRAFSVTRLGVEKAGDQYIIFGNAAAIEDLRQKRLRVWLGTNQTLGGERTAKMMGKAAIYKELAGFEFVPEEGVNYIEEEIKQVRDARQLDPTVLEKFMQGLYQGVQLSGEDAASIENRLRKTIRDWKLADQFETTKDELVRLSASRSELHSARLGLSTARALEPPASRAELRADIDFPPGVQITFNITGKPELLISNPNSEESWALGSFNDSTLMFHYAEKLDHTIANFLKITPQQKVEDHGVEVFYVHVSFNDVLHNAIIITNKTQKNLKIEPSSLKGLEIASAPSKLPQPQAAKAELPPPPPAEAAVLPPAGKMIKFEPFKLGGQVTVMVSIKGTKILFTVQLGKSTLGHPVEMDLNSGPFTFGRESGSSVVVKEPSVSKKHAKLTVKFENGQYKVTLKDLDSTNGTFVKDGKITEKELQELKLGPQPAVPAQQQAIPLPPQNQPVNLAPAAQQKGEVTRLEYDLESKKLTNVTYNLKRSTAALPNADARVSNALKGFNDFEDVNYEILKLMFKTSLTLNDMDQLLAMLRNMIERYLALYQAAAAAKPDSFEFIQEAMQSFEKMQQKIKSEINKLPPAEKPVKESDPLPPAISEMLRKLDKNLTKEIITIPPKDPYPANKLEKVGFHEMVNIVHQKAIRNLQYLIESYGVQKQQIEVKIRKEGEHAGSGIELNYMDARPKPDSSIPLPLQHVAWAFAKGQRVHKHSNLFNPSRAEIFADDQQAGIRMKLGVHSARIQYAFQSIRERGRIVVNYQDSYENHQGSEARLNFVKAMLEAIGFKTVASGKRLDAYYDKDSASSYDMSELPEKLHFVVQLLSAVKDWDLHLNHIPANQRQGLLNQLQERFLEDGYIGPDWQINPAMLEPKIGPADQKKLKDVAQLAGIELQPGHLGQRDLDWLMKQLERLLARGAVTMNQRGIPVRHADYDQAAKESSVKTFLKMLESADSAKLESMRKIAAIAKAVENFGEKRVIAYVRDYQVLKLTLHLLEDHVTFYILKEADSTKFRLAYAVLGDFYFDKPRTDRFRNKNLLTNLLSEKDLEELLPPHNMAASQTLLDWLDELGLKAAHGQKTIFEILNQGSEFLNRAIPEFETDAIKNGAIRGVISNTSVGGTIINRGKVIGRISLNQPNKPASAYRDAVFISEEADVSDDPKMREAAAIVGTTGGPLAHAAIQARELGKPSLILDGTTFTPGGIEFEAMKGQPKRQQVMFQGEVLTYVGGSDVEFKTAAVAEGDLVYVDATNGMFYLLAKADESAAQKMFQQYDLWKKSKTKLPQTLQKILSAISNDNLFRAVIDELVSSNFISEDALFAVLKPFLNDPAKKEMILSFFERKFRAEKAKFVKEIQNLNEWVTPANLNEIRGLYLILSRLSEQKKILPALMQLIQPEGVHPFKESLEKLWETSILSARKFQTDYRNQLLHRISRFLQEPEIQDLKDKLTQGKTAELDAEKTSRFLSRISRFTEHISLADFPSNQTYREVNAVLTQIIALETQLKEMRNEQNRLLASQFRVVSKEQLIDRYARDFSESEAFAGGKGANSAELQRALNNILKGEIPANVRHPEGVVIPASQYRIWMEKNQPNDLEPELKQELALSYRNIVDSQRKRIIEFLKTDSVTSQDFKKYLEVILNVEFQDITEAVALDALILSWRAGILRSLQMPTPTIHPLLRRNLEVFSSVAARSSGIKEDSKDAAMAGQKETVLNVDSLKKLYQAVIDVWKSGAEAVQIDEMTNPESGVLAFSMDEMTGAPNIRITSAHGLTKGLVDSEGVPDPDIFVLKRNGAPDYKLIQEHIGNKTRAIVLDLAAGGIKTVEINKLFPNDSGKARQPSLTKDQIQTVAKTADLLSQYFGYPLDIEGGFLGDELLIYQIRPITTLDDKIKEAKSLLKDARSEVRSARLGLSTARALKPIASKAELRTAYTIALAAAPEALRPKLPAVSEEDFENASELLLTGLNSQEMETLRKGIAKAISEQLANQVQVEAPSALDTTQLAKLAPRAKFVREKLEGILNVLIKNLDNDPAHFVIDLPAAGDKNSLGYYLQKVLAGKQSALRPILASTDATRGAKIVSQAQNLLKTEGFNVLPDTYLKSLKAVMESHNKNRMAIITLDQPRVGRSSLLEGLIKIEHEEDGVKFDELLPDERISLITLKLIEAIAIWLDKKPAELLRIDPSLVEFFQYQTHEANVIRFSLNRLRSEIRTAQAVASAA